MANSRKCMTYNIKWLYKPFLDESDINFLGSTYLIQNCLCIVVSK